MIPTLSRFSPTTLQLALTPPNNKSIAKQSPHQRSGFGNKQWNDMNKVLSKIVTLRSLSQDPALKDMSTLNQHTIFYKLKELERLAELFIHCLEQEGFLSKSRKKQEAIIRTFVGDSDFIPWPKALDELNESKKYVRVDGWKIFLKKVLTELNPQPSPQTG